MTEPTEPREIWLQPWCLACQTDPAMGERQWSSAELWPDDCGCGAREVKYVLAPTQTVSSKANNSNNKLKKPKGWHFELGQNVQKYRGASWQGRIVGFYSSSLTPEGYAVESENEPGSVRIYSFAALIEWRDDVMKLDTF